LGKVLEVITNAFYTTRKQCISCQCSGDFQEAFITKGILLAQILGISKMPLLYQDTISTTEIGIGRKNSTSLIMIRRLHCV
jgi:hypothetical protein